MGLQPVKKRQLSPQCVTYHAIVRYCQRVLDVHVDAEVDDSCAEAAAHCRAAGLTVDQVRHLIWCPAVVMAAERSLPNVGTRQFRAKLDPDGTVITILEPFRKPTQKLKILTDREVVSEAARLRRRRRKQADRYLKNQKDFEHD